MDCSVEPLVTQMMHQTSWLESTAVCGVKQNQAGGSSVRRTAQGPVVATGPNSEKALTSNDAIKRAVRKEMLLIFKCLHSTMIPNTLFSRWFGSPSSVSLHPQ